MQDVGLPPYIFLVKTFGCAYVRACLGNELVPDVGIVEPPPQLKLHSTTGPTPLQYLSLDQVAAREWERVAGLVREDGVWDTQRHVRPHQLERYFRP